MSEPVRVGVIGCARILPAHLRGIAVLQEAGLDPIRITALSARRRDDAMMFRRRGEGPPPREPASANPSDPLGAPHRYVSDLHPDVIPEVFDDWRALVGSDLVDAVLILTPVSLHHEMALAALDAGKHVLIEKPFAISVRAGRAVVARAAQAGLVAGVAENVRYSPRTRAQRWVLDQGLVGDPQLWLSGGIGGEWAPDRIVAHTPWRHRKLEAGGGPAIDLGVHLMHHIRYLMGPVDEVGALTATMEPTRVESDGAVVLGEVANELEDVFTAQLRFRSGAIGNVFSGWAGRGERGGLDASPLVYATRGCIRGDSVVGADAVGRRVVDLMERGASQAQLAQWFPSGVTDSFALELLDFTRAVAAGSEMEASGTEGVADLAMAYAILESSAAGHPVRPDDVLSGAVDGYQADIDAHYRLGARSQ